jgi:UDPglucose 6-dehydrogenase
MKIAVIGAGYVGLVSATCIARLGHDVICVDVVPERAKAVAEARPPFYEPGLPEMLADVLRKGKMRASTSVAESVAQSEMTIIAVGTPCRDGDIDLSYIESAARETGRALRDNPAYHVVVVKSTVVPGTTDTVVRQAVELASGRKLGEFGLCMNPEFLREGSAVSDFMVPDRIVIGSADERAGQMLGRVYESFDCPKLYASLRDAEMIKYASNSLLATMISFSNEMAALCEATPGTDVDRVLDGVHLDRRFTPVVNGQRISPELLTYLRAGCGFGGSCLPKDVTALRRFGQKVGVTPHLLDAVLAVNQSRPLTLTKMAEEAIGSLNGAQVTVLGLAFKPGTDDLRDSPALALVDILRKRGARVRAFDPFVPTLPQADVTLFASAAEALTGADVAVIASAVPELRNADWSTLAAAMKHPVLVDGRNALRGVALPSTLKYLPIGRYFQRMSFSEQQG